ncbi:hypothetical protein DB313_06305 (plasmid) [Borrelia turcica IST7]|uniref:DUF1640 domain-containing protein n=1 Tax=Borrelia turcica IST7 TaxID=1104446 RepID=A0A386PPS0_9SPIR|nr:Bdr family repetitive protein [Borrelia turcica]AYE37112.1 hypothetical protein DB313_06305 [Borrelia turcica IST7]
MQHTHITEQMVIDEFVKIGFNEAIASDIANRYYHNEISYQDLLIIKMELKGDISDVKNELKSDIVAVRNELKSDIVAVRNELKSDITAVRNELKGDITLLNVKVDNLDKNNKWLFGLSFAIWLTTIGGFIALFFK